MLQLPTTAQSKNKAQSFTPISKIFYSDYELILFFKLKYSLYRLIDCSPKASPTIHAFLILECENLYYIFFSDLKSFLNLLL